MLSLLFYWFLHMLMLKCLPRSKVDLVVLNFDLLCSFTFYAFLLFRSPPKTNLDSFSFSQCLLSHLQGILLVHHTFLPKPKISSRLN